MRKIEYIYLIFYLVKNKQWSCLPFLSFSYLFYSIYLIFDLVIYEWSPVDQ